MAKENGAQLPFHVNNKIHEFVIYPSGAFQGKVGPVVSRMHYLGPKLYDRTDTVVRAALASGDAAFVIDTRDFLALEVPMPANLGEPLEISAAEVYAIIQSDHWLWTRNFRCKYVRLVSRHGVLHLADRDGHPITAAKLRYQFGQTGEV